METSRERILHFIDRLSIKPKEFLLKTGVGKGFIDKSHQKSGATDTNLSKILENYPELNPEWLLTGKGSMLRSEQSSAFQNTQNEICSYRSTLEEKIGLLEKQIELLEENKELQNKVILQLERELSKVKSIDEQSIASKKGDFQDRPQEKPQRTNE